MQYAARDSQLPPQGGAASRIKDIAQLQSARDNQLVGYGLVIGLQGSGDSLRNSPFTEQSIRAMLENLGIGSEGGRARVENVAAVIVTANLPPFVQSGHRIDVSVSSLGDAQLARRRDAGHDADEGRRRRGARRRTGSGVRLRLQRSG